MAVKFENYTNSSIFENLKGFKEFKIKITVKICEVFKNSNNWPLQNLKNKCQPRTSSNLRKEKL